MFMREPKFIQKEVNGGFEYHLPVQYMRFFDRHVFDHTAFKIDEEAMDELLQFIAENAISSLIGWDENVVLYSLALEVLAKDNTCFLVYLDQPEVVNALQEDAQPERVEWCNSIHFMEEMEYCMQLGIQSPIDYVNAADYSDKNTSKRYFYLCEIDERNLHLFPKLYYNDVTNWFFLFCEPEKKLAVRSLLTNEKEKPEIEMILECCSSVVNIQIGGDEGYLDYVLIQSRADLSALIRTMEAKQTAFMEMYEQLLSECKPFDDEWKVDFFKDRYPELLEQARKVETK